VASVHDLVIVGGGPAGLGVAIVAARRGLDVLLLERGAFPVDKACGEGLLPAGVHALEALGARSLLAPAAFSPLRAIRWIDGDVVAEAHLPAPGGLGIRRTALSAALLASARAAGAKVREGAAVMGHRRLAGEVEVETEDGLVRARLLVAADGLASAIRAREGLDRTVGGAPRFGLRRHFDCPPWSDAVEVHFGDGVEAYVTPAGPGRVGIAFLCEGSARRPFPELLAHFPALADRLAGVVFDSRPAGAGPLRRAAGGRALDRLVLVGDAAGYHDAITGEGVSLALSGALALGEVLPEALAAGGGRSAFAGWSRGEVVRFARYAATARFVLWLARRPRTRRRVLGLLARQPALFSRLVDSAVL